LAEFNTILHYFYNLAVAYFLGPAYRPRWFLCCVFYSYHRILISVFQRHYFMFAFVIHK